MVFDITELDEWRVDLKVLNLKGRRCWHGRTGLSDAEHLRKACILMAGKEVQWGRFDKGVVESKARDSD